MAKLHPGDELIFRVAIPMLIVVQLLLPSLKSLGRLPFASDINRIK
jgi:hypothetical protein